MTSMAKFYTKGANLIKVLPKNPFKAELYVQYKKLSLKPVKRVQFKFDPFHANALSLREILFQLSTKRVKETHPECSIRTEILSNNEEPEMIVQLLNGHTLVYKTANLTNEDIVKHFNNYIEPLLREMED